MRKQLMLATVIGLCALSLSACQRGENKPAAPAPGATAEQTTPANPGSEQLNNNNTQEIANNANAPSPSGDNVQADNSAMSPAAPAAGDNSGSTAAPTDNSSSAPAAGSTPSTGGTDNSSMAPAGGSTPSTGGTDNSSTAPAGGSSAAPSSGGDNSSTTTPSDTSK